MPTCREGLPPTLCLGKGDARVVYGDTCVDFLVKMMTSVAWISLV